jgi:hypothetical protein
LNAARTTHLGDGQARGTRCCAMVRTLVMTTDGAR